MVKSQKILLSSWLSIYSSTISCALLKGLPHNVKISPILHSYHHYKFSINKIPNYWDESVLCFFWLLLYRQAHLTFVPFYILRCLSIWNSYFLLREEVRRKYLNIMFCNVFPIFQQLLDQPHSQFIQVEWFMKIWSQKWEKCQLLSFVKAY